MLEFADMSEGLGLGTPFEWSLVNTLKSWMGMLEGVKHYQSQIITMKEGGISQSISTRYSGNLIYHLGKQVAPFQRFFHFIICFP